MILNPWTQQKRAVALNEVRRQLSSLPIPWHEVEQAADDVVKANPAALPVRLAELISEAAVKSWSIGIGCC
jgi:hypothetical protein